MFACHCVYICAYLNPLLRSVVYNIFSDNCTLPVFFFHCCPETVETVKESGWFEERMASKEYTFSLLDPLSTLSLLEEISTLLCIDRPEFGPLFGEDHRRRVEEDVSKKKEVGKVRKVESKDEKVEEERGNKGEEEEERGLLTVVAATSSGKLVAHACIIASPARVSPISLG